MRYVPIWNKTEPAVEQPPINGWAISWNPDDSHWYVTAPDGETRSYSALRNAVQFARKHSPKE
jgi:hypothetical protein